MSEPTYVIVYRDGSRGDPQTWASLLSLYREWMKLSPEIRAKSGPAWIVEYTTCS